MTRLRGVPSSQLSEFADSFYREFPDFHFIDADHVVFSHAALPMAFARETRILRLIESKNLGEEVRRSQRETLPVLAACLDLGVKHGVVKRGSGVFVVTGEPGFESGATVARVRADEPGKEWSAVGVQASHTRNVTREELQTFLRCRLLEAA